MTPEQLTIVRQIRKPGIVLIILFILGRPSGETEIGRILEISSKSARDMLDSLERQGYVDNFKSASTDKWEGIPPDLAQAFREVKLMPNDRTRALAQQDHITPDYVRAIYRQLEERGMGNQTGLLVVQLEANMPAPDLREMGHVKGCTCEECEGPGRYKGWVSSYRDWD